MRRALFFLIILSIFALVPVDTTRAQMSDAEKRALFLRAREDIRPVPRANPTPTPKPRPRPAATPTPRPQATPERATPSARDDEDVPPRSSATPAPVQSQDTDEKPTEQAEPKRTVKLTPSPTPKVAPSPKPTPKATPQVTDNKPTAPIVIEKSGLEEDRGFEPAPKSSGGWFKRWKYLSPSVRRAIDTAKVKKGRWRYIIIHNSGTRQGNARAFDTYHRRVRKMSNGLAYHFVVGNGTSSGDGEIEIGSRWTRQINGGHVASDYLNDIAIGICLVGDFNRDNLTKAQVGALEELIGYLRNRVGKVKGKQAIVVPHKKINPKPTDCPGNKFPYSWLQKKFGS